MSGGGRLGGGHHGHLHRHWRSLHQWLPCWHMLWRVREGGEERRVGGWRDRRDVRVGGWRGRYVWGVTGAVSGG